ncbi:hypothetical protein Dsin_013950 [Dipteronia sinensis]|uniref:Reverse transcriptase zinc-binding domain-containing protein n=1 Tax=Dipteronia sinensis TaxID=43782 RepID=A0AAE0ALM7_9ROSI|nr:hypothetical protein Dsin_013950 [Dipteronia sinensis]
MAVVEKRCIWSIGLSFKKARASGGLGVGSVQDKNKGLLAKWAWRFGKEENSLWKQVLCSKYGIPLNTLRWNWNGGPSSSFFVKAVGGLYAHGSNSAKVMDEGLRVGLDGQFTVKSFWQNLESGEHRDPSVFKEIWRGFCPPKVEVFVWTILQGRASVKEVLNRFGLLIGNNME